MQQFPDESNGEQQSQGYEEDAPPLIGVPGVQHLEEEGHQAEVSQREQHQPSPTCEGQGMAQAPSEQRKSDITQEAACKEPA